MEDFMIFSRVYTCCFPEKDLIPGFTSVSKGEASESTTDEKDILIDKDLTVPSSPLIRVERFENTDTELEPLEDLPPPFMRGEVDVRQQMDIAASALDSSLRGLQNQSEENSPRGELGASFRDTPGGLEEVCQKTDQYLATHGYSKISPKMKQRKKGKLTRVAKGF
jgi:hypothetical protein